MLFFIVNNGELISEICRKEPSLTMCRLNEFVQGNESKKRYRATDERLVWEYFYFIV